MSERTILRDMDALSAAGVPVYTERGPHGGCRLLDGFTTDASGLTAAEGQALFSWSSRESAAELGLGPQLAGALAKIAASAPSGVTSRAESLGAVLLSDRRRWFAAAESVPLLPRLREAAQERRRVRLRYRSAGASDAGTRTVDPYGLVDQSGVWYLVAAHRGRDRTFRVSRIQDAIVLTEPVRLPFDADLEEVWVRLREQFERDRGRPVTLEVEVADEAAAEFRRLITTQLVSAGDIEVLGRHATVERWRLTVRAHRAALAMSWAWAPHVRVVAPAELVADIRRQSAVAVALYDAAPDRQP